MVTIYYLIVVEDRSRQLVSQWTLRDDNPSSVIAGQIIELAPFKDSAPRPLVATWVQHDPKRDIQEIDVGAVWLDEHGTTGSVHEQIFWTHLREAGWIPTRPSFEAK